MIVNWFLYRHYLGETYTIGKLYNVKQYLCDTLEDKVRDLNKDGDLDDPGEGKVFGETAIPYGRYRVILTWSPKFKRLMPEVLLVKHFTSIRIHALTTEKETLGCIGVGENKIKGKLINSRAKEILITILLKELIEKNNEVYLNVV
jgi:hypothetical protein